jgi:pSer/pThr/pTyr-binding forkhead associated (FHA) protein
MAARLQIDGDSYALGDLTFVGRDPTCEIAIDDESVNGFHILIVRRRTDHLLIDFKSAEGTLVNGLPCSERALRDRDSIQIGTRILVYRQPRRESSAPGRKGLELFVDAAEHLAGLIDETAARIGPCRATALCRPSSTGDWWLMAGDGPSLGKAKQEYLDEWACKGGPFLTLEPVSLDGTDEPEHGSREVWFSGVAHRWPRSAELLLLFESTSPPGERRDEIVTALEELDQRVTAGLGGTPAPTSGELPGRVNEADERPPAGRLVLDGRSLDLHPATVYRIGRDPARCDLVIGDDLASRQHALVVVDPLGTATLLDYRSVNGVRTGAGPIRRALLSHGDTIEIGSTRIVFEAVDGPATRPLGSHADDFAPCLGIKARVSEIEAYRQHFEALRDPVDIMHKLMVLVREQFGINQLALLWLPTNPSLVPDQIERLTRIQILHDGRPPLLSLRTGVMAQAIAHVLSRRQGFFVRDFNLLACQLRNDRHEKFTLASVGSLVVTPLMVDGPHLVVLVGGTRIGARLLGRADWGSIQALVQATADRLKELIEFAF